MALSDAEGARQPRQDKEAKDIWNCVIKQLLCCQASLAAGQMALLSAARVRAKAAVWVLLAGTQPYVKATQSPSKAT